MDRTVLADDNTTVRFAGIERALEVLLDPQRQFVGSDPATKRRALATMSNAEFDALVLELNALLRDRDPATHSLDGDGVTTTFLKFPNQRDKPQLLHHAAATMRAIAADTSLNDADALRRIGLTCAGALTLIHPFGNGNGRTARCLSYVIDQPILADEATKRSLRRVATDRTAWQTGVVHVDGLEHHVLMEARAAIDPQGYPFPSRPDATYANEFTADELEAAFDLSQPVAMRAAAALNEESAATVALFGTLLRREAMRPEFLVGEHGRHEIRAHDALRSLGPQGVEEFLDVWDELRVALVDEFLGQMARPSLTFTKRGVVRTVPEAYAAQLVEHSAVLRDGSERHLT